MVFYVLPIDSTLYMVHGNVVVTMWKNRNTDMILHKSLVTVWSSGLRIGIVILSIASGMGSNPVRGMLLFP